MPPRRPTTTIKYPGEARGAFGVAMRKKPDGSMEGVRCELFDYTNKKVVGCTGYEDARQAELIRVKPLGNEWGQPGAGYKERWPETWSEELDKRRCRKNSMSRGGLGPWFGVYRKTPVGFIGE